MKLTDQPQCVNPLRLAKSGQQISGDREFALLERLKGILFDTDGKVSYDVVFYIDESGVCVVDITIVACLCFECQRCLQAVAIDINKNSLLAIVAAEDKPGDLPEEYEPLILDNGMLSVEELVEDELLLAIPLSPLHEENKCPAKQNLDKLSAAETKLTPFAVLATLKKETR